MSWVARNRALLIIIGIVLGVLLAVTFLGERGSTTEELHPDNTTETGTRAVFRVLEEQGVDVEIARNAAELDDLRIGARTTVVVSSTTSLSPTTTDRLLDAAEGAGTLVVLAPPPAIIDRFDRSLSQAGVGEGSIDAQCSSRLFNGLEIDVPLGPAYAATDANSCFDGLLVTLDTEPRTYIVGGTGLLSNDAVLRADNAAVALRLLGQQPRLIWYVADAADIPPGDGGTLVELLPDWIGPATILALAVVIAAMIWRGRRLGPLVVEPLPVVVPARETIDARGRLYRRSRDRDHAAELLRRTAARRIADHVGVPRSVSSAELVDAVARAPEARDVDVTVLRPARVSDDQALVRLASELAALEALITHPQRTSAQQTSAQLTKAGNDD